MIVAMLVAAGVASAAPSASPAPTRAPSRQSAAQVLHMMAAANAAVNSYQVRIHFDADVRAFLRLPLELNATYYFKKPDRAQIVFDEVPALAKQFQSFYASIGTPETWPHDYRISVRGPAAGDPLNSVALVMLPRQQGSLSFALITVDTTTWAIIGQSWRYRDGSSIEVTQENWTDLGYVLPMKQVADFDFPHYKAHVVAAFGSYQINVPIPDSVFNQPAQQ